MAGKYIDETGKRYGKLVVIGVDPEYKPQSGKHTKWLCQCDCGNQKIIQGSNLRKGVTKSCGCLVTEHITNVNIAKRKDIYPETKFGLLTVVEKDKVKSEKEKKGYYLCKCDCGKIISVYGGHLRAGSYTSCGCSNKSKGVIAIENWLKLNSIDYIQEFKIPGLVGKRNKPLKFDFAIYNNGILSHLIEFNGIQHYEVIDYWYGVEGLEARQICDMKKLEWCENNNIELLTIKFDEKDIPSILKNFFSKILNPVAYLKQNASTTYLIGDLHLNHDKEFLWGSRGFNSIKEHNNQMIKNLQEIIKPTDNLILMGDSIMGKIEDSIELMEQIPGQVFFIRGNHESKPKVASYEKMGWIELPNVFQIEIKHQIEIIFSHYPIDVSLKSSHNHPFAFNVHAHTHSTEFKNSRNYCVSADAIQLKPIKLMTIIEKIEDEVKRNAKND